MLEFHPWLALAPGYFCRWITRMIILHVWQFHCSSSDADTIVHNYCNIYQCILYTNFSYWIFLILNNLALSTQCFHNKCSHCSVSLLYFVPPKKTLCCSPFQLPKGNIILCPSSEFSVGCFFYTQCTYTTEHSILLIAQYIYLQGWWHTLSLFFHYLQALLLVLTISLRRLSQSFTAHYLSCFIYLHAILRRIAPPSAIPSPYYALSLILQLSPRLPAH